MKHSTWLWRSLLTGVCLGTMWLSSGCTYLKYRGQDAMDMIDIGFTFSSKPGFALWYDFVPVIPVGIGYVDGQFLGLGGGQFGLMPHYEESYGLGVWGQEEVGFGDFDIKKPETVDFQRSGLIGMIQGPFPGPDYMISCPHYIHLGWIGVVGSPRYLQMADFLLGWIGLDICFDDGMPRGTWFGRSMFGTWSPPPEAAVPAPKDGPLRR